jgi:hypothetical protein
MDLKSLSTSWIATDQSASVGHRVAVLWLTATTYLMGWTVVGVLLWHFSGAVGLPKSQWTFYGRIAVPALLIWAGFEFGRKHSIRAFRLLFAAALLAGILPPVRGSWPVALWAVVLFGWGVIAPESAYVEVIEKVEGRSQ